MIKKQRLLKNLGVILWLIILKFSGIASLLGVARWQGGSVLSGYISADSPSKIQVTPKVRRKKKNNMSRRIRHRDNGPP
jgi:hypothetical protein